jgi:hypothetical protein
MVVANERVMRFCRSELEENGNIVWLRVSFHSAKWANGVCENLGVF